MDINVGDTLLRAVLNSKQRRCEALSFYSGKLPQYSYLKILWLQRLTRNQKRTRLIYDLMRENRIRVKSRSYDIMKKKGGLVRSPTTSNKLDTKCLHTTALYCLNCFWIFLNFHWLWFSAVTASKLSLTVSKLSSICLTLYSFGLLNCSWNVTNCL